MNGSDWKKPPPKLVKKKRPFPKILFILSVILIYIIGVSVSWVFVGRIIPFNVILIIWAFIDLFFAVIILCILLIILRYMDKKIQL